MDGPRSAEEDLICGSHCWSIFRLSPSVAFERKMKASPMFVKYEEEEVFDAHLDFAMFLEEARQHTNEARRVEALEDAVKQAECLKDNKKKKSWKRSLMFWRKSEKKIKPEHETPPPRESFHSNFPKQQQPRRNALSGPIHGSSGGQMGAMKRASRPTSGPLAAALFTTSRRNEFEIPYMCLEQQNKPVRCEAFGPIYLVT
ncbi:hypothetical protein ACLOJK_025118 [Asimina triloba]